MMALPDSPVCNTTKQCHMKVNKSKYSLVELNEKKQQPENSQIQRTLLWQVPLSLPA